MTTKQELLALSDEKPTSINDDLYAWATQAAAALREFAGMLDAPHRVPLTDEEIEDIANSPAGHDPFTFTSAIEAAHGIKNDK
jgi:hypothetical protein